MKPMNSTKKCNESLNNSKNKLNNKIILIFHRHPNTHLIKCTKIDFDRMLGDLYDVLSGDIVVLCSSNQDP